MTVRVDGLPPCSACGGPVAPLVLCERCGAATIVRDVQSLEAVIPCSECEALSPWQLICDQCHLRFPAPAGLEPPPRAGEGGGLGSGPATNTPARRRRRVRGDVDTRALMDLMNVLGLDASRSRALIDRGYDALWKIARAKEETLARIPEVGPVAARKVVASFHLLNYAPPRRTRESIAQDEYECALCRCVTSAFAPRCVECGVAFEEEEMEEAVRRSFAEEGDAAILGFYDGRLAEKSDDPELYYARGLLLESLGEADQALDSLDRAVSIVPDAKKIRVAQLRVQARYLRKPEIAAKLRTTAKALLDDIAWEQEVAQLDQLISGEERRCPHCGTIAPASVALCPSCGGRLSAPPAEVRASREPSPTPELDALVDDLLVGELEESLSTQELELTKAAVLDWLIEELEQSMAPDTQVVLPPTKRADKPVPEEESPLAESVGFLSSWMRASAGLVSGLRPKRGPHGAGRVNGIVNGRGRVNGLVNGVGRTNGLVNGLGHVNGLMTPAGRVNGLVTTRGRVNGLTGVRGRINGMQAARPTSKGLRLPTPSRRVRYASIAGGVLVAVLIVGLLVVPPPVPSDLITIDGSFADWASVPQFDAATSARDADVSLDRYAAFLDRDALFLFASMRGATLGDATDLDGVFFLVDADGDPATGFSFDGLGADGVVEVFGGHHEVEGARLYSFPEGSEVNWSQRQGGGAVRAAASAQGLEAMVSTYDLERFRPTDYRIAVYADDFQGLSSRSTAFLVPTGGSILAEVAPLASLLGSSPTDLFEVRVRALGLPAGATWSVSDLTTASPPGVSVSLSPESVTLTLSQPEAVLTASVSAQGFFPGDAIDVEVTGATAPQPVVVRGSVVRAYVLAAPPLVRIDGLFADWNGNDDADSDSTPVNNSNVDIVQYGAAVDASRVYFHVAVDGSLFEGRVPQSLVRSFSGPSGNGTTRPIPLPRVTGEDLLRVYVDVDAAEADGFPIGGIRADFLFEVRGESGRIRSRTLSAWNASWTPIPLASAALAKDATDLEGSLSVSPTTNRTQVVFAMTDWSGIGDTTTPANATVQAPAPVPERSGQVVHAPEFHEIAVPVAGTLLIGLWYGRRRRRSD